MSRPVPSGPYNLRPGIRTQISADPSGDYQYTAASRGATVYYGDSTVSKDSYTGTIATGNSVTFTATTFFTVSTDLLNGQPQSASLFVTAVPVDEGLRVVHQASTSAQLGDALTACATAGGGTVELAPGTYTGNFVIPPKTTIDGLNRSAVTLTQANGANGDVIQGQNFATLTGKAKATGDYALGAPESSVRNVTIDGNKANNASGFGVRVWGRATHLDHVLVRNCKQDGIWTEFTDVDSFSDPTQVLEAFYNDIRCINNDGNGWTHRGPHDAVGVGFTSYGNAGWALSVDESSGHYNGGISLYLPNSFLNTAGSFRVQGNAYIIAYGGAASGSNTGTGISLPANSGSSRFIGTAVAGHTPGVILRGSNHLLDIVATNNPSDVVQVGDGSGNGAQKCTVRVNGSNNTNVLNVLNEAGPNMFTVCADIGVAQTLQTGSALNSQSTLIATANGAGGTFSATKLPASGLANANGYTPTLPQTNSPLIGGGSGNVTYSASMTPDLTQGSMQTITVTNGTAMTINAPGAVTNGGLLSFRIYNNSGGAMGAITWNAVYSLAGAFTNPANGKVRTITFFYDTPLAKWVELSRAAADI